MIFVDKQRMLPMSFKNDVLYFFSVLCIVHTAWLLVKNLHESKLFIDT